MKGNLNGKILWVFFAAFLILVGAACGGGGGSSSTASSTATSTSTSTSGNTTTTGTISDVHLSAVVASNTAQVVDPADVPVGTTLQMQVVALNSSGSFAVENSSNWTTNAPASVATLSSSGVLTAVGPSATSYTVQATGPLGKVTGTIQVVAATEPVVTGLVRDQNSVNVSQVYVKFYNKAGTQVGEALTSNDGTFSANVASSAVGFTVDVSVADPIVNGTSYFYRQFEYKPSTTTFDYLGADSSCLAPLPALASGTVALPSPIVLDDRSNGPPPPPTGCGQ